MEFKRFCGNWIEDEVLLEFRLETGDLKCGNKVTVLKSI